MSKKETTKRLIYKKAVFAGGTANLQDLVDKAVARFPAALDRELTRADDASLMLNTTRPNVGQTTCGVIVRFTRGNNQAIVGLDPKAKELPVAQLQSPPLNGNSDTEFVENLGYFSLRGNEIIIVQSLAVRERAMQEYLNWLVRNRSGLIPENDFFTLDDVSSAKFRRHKIKDVKAFDFDVGIRSTTDSRSVTKADATVLPTGPEFQGLKKLLEGVGIDLQAVALDPREADAIKLSVRIEINRRSFDEQSALLNTLGDLANRDLHDESFQIEFDNGLRLSGEDLFISKPLRFPAVGGIADPFAVFREMATFLDELKDDRRLKGI